MVIKARLSSDRLIVIFPVRSAIVPSARRLCLPRRIVDISLMFPTLPRTDTESPSLEFWRISVIAVHLLVDSSANWKQYSVGEGWVLPGPNQSITGVQIIISEETITTDVVQVIRILRTKSCFCKNVYIRTGMSLHKPWMCLWTGRGRISYDQNVIKLTFIASNFDNCRPNYLMKSVKLCYIIAME